MQRKPQREENLYQSQDSKVKKKNNKWLISAYIMHDCAVLPLLTCNRRLLLILFQGKTAGFPLICIQYAYIFNLALIQICFML